MTIKVPYASGWVVVSTGSGKIEAHAKEFADIVAKAEKLPGGSSDHAIMAAAKSYHNHIMVVMKRK